MLLSITSHYAILVISTTQIQQPPDQTKSQRTNKQLIKTYKITIHKRPDGRSQHEPNHENH